MNTPDPDKSLTPSERAQLNDLAKQKFLTELDAEGRPNRDDPFNKLMEKVGIINEHVQRYVKPILAAGGHVPTPENKLGMQATLIKLYTESFYTQCDKDELAAILGWVYTSTAMSGLFPEKLGAKPKII